jgi:catechol 2,3-dioxygenase-like lactoylglutathione lyase family enzyme
VIDHVSVAVRDLTVAARFYETVLATLGYTKLIVRPGTAGFGKKYPEFWLNERQSMSIADPDSGAHICLRASDTRSVDAFHAAALAAGGLSDGAPGRRPEYTEGYYAAFVRDPDGNKIEAVTFVKSRA